MSDNSEINGCISFLGLVGFGIGVFLLINMVLSDGSFPFPVLVHPSRPHRDASRPVP